MKGREKREKSDIYSKGVTVLVFLMLVIQFLFFAGYIIKEFVGRRSSSDGDIYVEKLENKTVKEGRATTLDKLQKGTVANKTVANKAESNKTESNKGKTNKTESNRVRLNTATESDVSKDNISNGNISASNVSKGNVSKGNVAKDNLAESQAVEDINKKNSLENHSQEKVAQKRKSTASWKWDRIELNSADSAEVCFC